MWTVSLRGFVNTQKLCGDYFLIFLILTLRSCFVQPECVDTTCFSASRSIEQYSDSREHALRSD